MMLRNSPVALIDTRRNTDGVIAELILNKVGEAQAQGIDAIARAHGLLQLHQGTGPIAGARRIAANYDYGFGARQKIRGPKPLRARSSNASAAATPHTMAPRTLTV